MLNALTLWLIAAWVMYRAFRRFDETHHIHGELVLGVGALGLIVNIAATWILRRSAEHSVIAARAFGIQHITLQVERSPEGCTEHHHVDHLYGRTADEARAVIS